MGEFKCNRDCGNCNHVYYSFPFAREGNFEDIDYHCNLNLLSKDKIENLENNNKI